MQKNTAVAPQQEAPVRMTDVGDRPEKTVREDGAAEINWSRTFHVDTVDGFVNGMFALFQDSFEGFLENAGRSAQIGQTVLYQVKDPLHLRFEIKKLGVSEFQVRGSHFATPVGTNICVGLNPTDQ